MEAARRQRAGRRGVQREFGIGLPSFWTLGEDLLLTSAGDDGRALHHDRCCAKGQGSRGQAVHPTRPDGA